MAHELDTNATTGKKSMFSVRLTPWHNEGVILNEAPTFAEALVLSGTDYDVELRPIYLSVPGAQGFVETKAGVAVVRTDRNTALSVVSERYSPLQNRDAFAVLEPLLDAGVAKLETGGSLREGMDAWMLVQFNIDDPVVREVFADEVVPFTLISNSHSGMRRAVIMETPIRVVCANTLGVALAGMAREHAVSVRHRGNARVKVVEAAEEMLAGIVERYRHIAEQYRTLKSTRFTVEQFIASVLNVVAPLPEVKDEVGTGTRQRAGFDRAMTLATNRRQRITDLWTGGDGHKGDHSAWEAYNGTIQCLDHEDMLFPTKGSRVEALKSGRLIVKKEAVLEAVYAECLKVYAECLKK